MKIPPPLSYVSLLASMLMCSCTEEAPGLQQKMAELQARLAAKQAEVTDLQAKLAEARAAGAVKPAEGVAPAALVDESAAVGAAADELARALAEGLKPGQLQVSSKVALAGLTLRTASGSRGLALPFFYNHASAKWESGWSTEQIKAALQGADSPAAVAGVSQAPLQQPAAVPAAVPAQPTAAPMRLPRGWTYDASTGQVTASDGTTMPPLKQGERYEMIVGGAGETPRPVVVSEDGSQRLIVR